MFGTDTFSVLAQSSTPGPLVYFGQSNLAGKFIILLLIAASMVAWTVMIGKTFDLRRRRAVNLAYEERLTNVERLLNLDIIAPAGGRGAYANLVAVALQAYYRFTGTGEVARKAKLGHVDHALQRELAVAIEKLESKMIMLASIVTGAPFLGLLGTVWGVMDAFGGVALEGNATIQTLAPGVSGALLTTVAGLIVAIPSVFGYNFLLVRVKKMSTELESFASTVADRIELEEVNQ